MKRACIFIGGNLSEERLSPEPLSKDFLYWVGERSLFYSRTANVRHLQYYASAVAFRPPKIEVLGSGVYVSIADIGG